MVEDNNPYGTDAFCSDLIDLSGIDLSALSRLPDSVLRSAIGRVLQELASNVEASASFQSCLPRLRPAGDEPEIDLWDDNQNVV